MKLNLPSFRNYVVKCEQSLGRLPWVEMAMGHQIVDQIPINTNLAAFLSFVPGGTGGQAIALHYIMTRGLYDAAMGRHVLAQKASQELGREVHDHEIFSKEAHAHDPKLAEFWQRNKDEYFNEWEPQTIPTTRGREVNIAALNKILVSHGFKPFKFGDTDGFIEYAENGSWSFPVSHQSHMGQGEEHHKRNGIDLSNPKYVQFPVTDANGEDKYGFSFGHDTQWEPPSQNDTQHYKAIIHDLKTRSGREIKDILSGKESPDHLLHGDEEGQTMRNFIKNLHQGNQLTGTTHDDVNPMSKKGSLYYQCRDQNEFDELSEMIWKGIYYYNQQREPRGNIPTGSDQETQNMQWSEEDLKNIGEQLFDPETLQIRKRLADPIVLRHWKRFGFTQPRNYKNVETFLNAAKKHGGMKFGRTEYYPTANYKDYTGVPQYDKTPIVNPRQDIAELMGSGFVYAGPQTIDDPAATKIRLKRHNDIVQFVKDPDGKWYRLDKVQGSDPNTQIEPSSMMLRGGVHRDKTNQADPNRSIGTISTGNLLATPAYDNALQNVKDTWFHDPAQFGDKLGKDGVPESIYNAAATGMSRAAKGLNMTRDQINALVGGKNGLLGIAWSELDKLAAGWQFKFGVPGKEHKSKVDTDIYGLLRKHAEIADPNHAQAIVDKFNQIIKHREIVPSDFDDLGNGNAIYQAFLENGFHWRSSQVANRVDAEIKKIELERRREGAGKTSKDSEGNESDVITNADAAQGSFSDNAPVARTARVNRADKEKAVRVDSLQNVLRNQAQQRDADLKNRPFFNARRSLEVAHGESMPYRNAYDAMQSITSVVEIRGAAQSALFKLGKTHGQEEAKGSIDGVCDKVVQLMNGYLDNPNLLDPENVKNLAKMYQTFIPKTERLSLVSLANASGIKDTGQSISDQLTSRIMGNHELLHAISGFLNQGEEASAPAEQPASQNGVSVRNPETGAEDTFQNPEDLKAIYDQTKRRYDILPDKNSPKAMSLNKYMKDLYNAAINASAPANFRALFSTAVSQNLPQQAASNPAPAQPPARIGFGLRRPSGVQPPAPAAPAAPQPPAPAPPKKVSWDNWDDESHYGESLSLETWADVSFYEPITNYKRLTRFEDYKKTH